HATGLRIRHAHLPDAGVRALHGVGARIPAVPVADDGHRLRVGRPDGEVGFGAEEMRAELLVQAAVRALPEEVRIVSGKSDSVFSDSWHGGGVISNGTGGCYLGAL